MTNSNHLFQPVYPAVKQWQAKYNDQAACQNLATALKPVIEQVRTLNKDIIVLCIGTDRSTGDSLGPLVGSALSKKDIPSDVHIYGSLEQPVHALNLPQIKHTAFRKCPQAFTIALDASLGNADNIGVINAGYGAIRPGSGVNKQLSPVGDFHVTATVNVGGYMEYTILQNTRLSLVIKIADKITDILEFILQK